MTVRVLDAFKIKPYDLEPVFAEWTKGPRFLGKPKKDLPVDEWLERIKAGCIQRKIPEEYWHKVAQHFMGPDARARLSELKAVIAKVHGGKYRWTWKKFKVAMENMGWEIDGSKTETIKVSKQGSWWTLRKKDEPKKEDQVTEAGTSQRPATLRSQSSFWTLKRRGSETRPREDAPLPPLPTSSDHGKRANVEVAPARRSPPSRSNTVDFWPMRKTEEPEEISTSQHPTPSKSRSETDVTSTKQTPSRRNSDTVTTVTQAPAWLLNACSALEYITSEHPKTMSIISAILITAGTIPTIPAISAGAGGAILASHAAQAIGAIAVGLGQALNSSAKIQHDQQKQLEGPTTLR